MVIGAGEEMGRVGIGRQRLIVAGVVALPGGPRLGVQGREKSSGDSHKKRPERDSNA
jgi:hypothetical protein